MADEPKGLNIEVGASAKFERKVEIKVSEPEDVTRAKAEALLDFLKPFTQGSGIIGDWLEGAREHFKLQRIKTLTAVALEARAAIDALGKVPQSVPAKALVPILERASLEEPDDETLTKAWGALLASASTDYDPEVIAFSRILSELSPRECMILDRLCSYQRGGDDASADRSEFPMRRFYEGEGEIKPLLLDAVTKQDRLVFDKLRTYVDPATPMQFTVAYTRGTTKRINWIDNRLLEPFYGSHELGFTLLAAQGLVQLSGQAYSWGPVEKPVGVDWASLTDLGRRFVARVTSRPR